MTAAELAARLPLGAKRRGEWYDGRCPAHRDQDPSFSFKDGDRGVVLKCRAGCTAEAIAQALGLKIADLFFDANAPQTHRTSPKALTVEFLAATKGVPVEFLRSLGVEQAGPQVKIAYKTMDGSLAPRQRLRSAVVAKDGSKWSKGAGPLVPYGLWRLAEAQQTGHLFLVEGESDCWTLWHHGRPALGLPGADQTKLLQLEHLEGIDQLFVIKEPDRGGEAFVRGLTQRLDQLQWVGQARVVSMPEGLKDVNDLHRADSAQFKERLRTAMEAAPRLERTDRAAADEDSALCDASDGSATKPSLEISSCEVSTPWAAAQPAPDLLNSPEAEIGWLEPKLLAPGTITGIFAPRGLGKSHVAHAIAVKLARAGCRGLLIDRDNARREIKRRLRAWGAAEAPLLKVLTRDEAPPLTDRDSWIAFPLDDYDLVVIDSLDASTEGVGEKDSAKPSKAIAAILDLARQTASPAFLLLGNTIKSAEHSRGSGVIEDRCDIVYEVRDATSFEPSGKKPWWLELPLAGVAAWGERSARRRRRTSYRLAFVSSKFRPGEEPDPFILELDLSTEPWTMRDVTDEVVAAGEAARDAAEEEREIRLSSAAKALAAAVQAGAESGTPMLKGEAEMFLKEYELTQKAARGLLRERNGQDWRIESQANRPGRPKILLPVSVAPAAPAQSGAATTESGPSETPPQHPSREEGASVARMNTSQRKSDTLTPAPQAGTGCPGLVSSSRSDSAVAALDGMAERIASTRQSGMESPHGDTCDCVRCVPGVPEEWDPDA